MGGGDQERTKDVELTLVAFRSSGGALGAEQKVRTYSVLYFVCLNVIIETCNITYLFHLFVQ